jgi:nucleoid-associated protein YgaU
MGKDKILFFFFFENEDRVYTFEQGLLQKQEGYYIYYEMNLPMQEYMVSVREKLQRKTVGESGQDVGFGEFVGGGQLGSANLYERIGGVRQGEVVTEAEAALQGYRSMLLEKSTIKGKRKRAFLYTAASAAMVALCVLGITSINNYEKMREVEQALSSLTQNLEEEVPAGVIIDSVPSDLGNQQVEGAPNTDDGSEDEKQEFEIIPEQSEEPEQGEQGEPQGAVQGEPVVQVDTVNSSGQGEPPVQVSTVDSAGQGEPPVHVDTVNSAGQGEQPVQVATVNSAGQGEPAVQVATANSAGQGELAVQVATVNSSVQTYLDQGYYIVEAGDKLELICRRIYNTTAIMDKICELNHIKNVDKITIGQKILLP